MGVVGVTDAFQQSLLQRLQVSDLFPIGLSDDDQESPISEEAVLSKTQACTRLQQRIQQLNDVIQHIFAQDRCTVFIISFSVVSFICLCLCVYVYVCMFACACLCAVHLPTTAPLCAPLAHVTPTSRRVAAARATELAQLRLQAGLSLLVPVSTYKDLQALHEYRLWSKRISPSSFAGFDGF